MLHFIIPLSEALYSFANVLDRDAIRAVTKNETGIYCWINNVNGPSLQRPIRMLALLGGVELTDKRARRHAPPGYAPIVA
jgi:hypothetical protein